MVDVSEIEKQAKTEEFSIPQEFDLEQIEKKML